MHSRDRGLVEVIALKISANQKWSVHFMGGASGVAGGSFPLCPVPPPAAPPVVVRKNHMCPRDPSRPLSQCKVYVKIHEMCQNTA